MRRRKAKALTLWPFVLALGLSVGLAGCASERAQLRNAADAYSTTLEVLTDARQAGLIDDATAAEIEEWRAIAREALDAWRLAVETGKPAEGHLQRFNEAMRVLTQAMIEAEEAQARRAAAAPKPGAMAPGEGGSFSEGGRREREDE